MGQLVINKCSVATLRAGAYLTLSRFTRNAHTAWEQENISWGSCSTVRLTSHGEGVGTPPSTSMQQSLVIVANPMRVISRYGPLHGFIGLRRYHWQRWSKGQYLPEINVDIYGILECEFTSILNVFMRATCEASLWVYFLKSNKYFF